MAGKSKPKPLEAFELNMADADQLVLLADGLTNQRVYRMRKEMRSRLGEALKVPRKEHDTLDCIESPDVFVVLKPGGRLTRANFDQHEPLLRQAIVAACAALETYLADRTVTKVRTVVNSGNPLPAALTKVAMDVGNWHHLETEYQRRKRGITEVVLEPHIRSVASTAPNKVGLLLSLVGINKGLNKVDGARTLKAGTTAAALERITSRRNSIAHSGDRKGRGRAAITQAEVVQVLTEIRSIVAGLEKVFDE